ncbi:MAG: cytochrome c4 [Hyphomicrobiales bacterium]|nr:MAG: cytochrome c4 [Hyphomicrobiales bacterium]
MKISTITQSFLIGAMAIGISAGASAADKKLLEGASADMLANTCAGCHGTDGASAGPGSPNISGLSVDYFIETMQGFKDGSIPSTIMTRIAKGYSDAEFKTLAMHFGKLKFVKAKGQAFDAELAKDGAKIHDKYCEKCHADGGTNKDDDSGVLAGQWTPYLKWTLADYINFVNDAEGDKREPTKKMRKRLKKMLEDKGEAGVTALLNYYASQQ